MSTLDHEPWCQRASHPEGSDTCFGESLNLPELGLSSFPQRTDDGTELALFVGETAALLDPQTLRPLAMLLLAHDCALTGDTAAADYYRGEALRGQVGV